VKKGFTVIELLVVIAVIAVLAGIVVSVVGARRKNFVSEPTPIVPTATPEAAPRHENSVNQKFTRVPPDQLNEWLAACKERVVCITPLMHNAMNELYIDSYLVVTEGK
jgi:prepilin-type N-terminal cleavage/methylation domain-containing protein